MRNETGDWTQKLLGTMFDAWQWRKHDELNNGFDASLNDLRCFGQWSP